MQSVSASQLLESHSLEQLKQASTFGALSADTIRWLLNEGSITRLDRGESLFEPGQRGDSFFVILHGAFSYYRSGNDQYAYIRDYRTGQQIGFANTLALHERVGMAISTQEALVLEIDYRLFNRLRQEMPSEFGLMMMNLARELARTIRTIDDAIVDIKTHGIIMDSSGLV